MGEVSGVEVEVHSLQSYRLTHHEAEISPTTEGVNCEMKISKTRSLHLQSL